mgnify:CR=1 FL=1
MAEAVITATAQLCDLRCDRRVLIVLTDGAPDNAVEARAAIDLAEHRDVETYCVAIGTDAGKKLFDRWQRIDTVTDLPSKLVALLKRQVLGVSLGDVA